MWAGNDNIHLMTSDSRQELRVELRDWDGASSYAMYDNFSVDSERNKYKLVSVGQYSGTAGQYGVQNVDV